MGGKNNLPKSYLCLALITTTALFSKERAFLTREGKAPGSQDDEVKTTGGIEDQSGQENQEISLPDKDSPCPQPDPDGGVKSNPYLLFLVLLLLMVIF